jgi:hypothetical protein
MKSLENCPTQKAPGFIPQCLKTALCLNATNRRDYLCARENRTRDIDKFDAILRMPHVLLEIGCGDGEAARQIALRNPGMGIIATDLYDCSDHQCADSTYRQIARKWRTGQLQAQLDAPDNLVILKAEAEFLCYLPCRTIDTIYLLNPEPRVGKSVLHLVKNESLAIKIKKGASQIVIVPYSRELGLSSCGGCSFEHDPDWSKGLGFLMQSGLCFKLGTSMYWGVDLSEVSAYSRNSTQRGVYVFGEPVG